jgi:hypothetical protein
MNTDFLDVLTHLPSSEALESASEADTRAVLIDPVLAALGWIHP